MWVGREGVREGEGGRERVCVRERERRQNEYCAFLTSKSDSGSTHNFHLRMSKITHVCTIMHRSRQ